MSIVMKKQAALLLMCGILLLGLMGCGQKIPETQVSDTAQAGKTQKKSDLFPATIEPEQSPVSYVAENEKYALALPDAEHFVRELQDFIYWEHATEIEKDTHGLMSILSNLEDNNCLEKKLKLHLYYYECDVSEMDEGLYNFYNVVVMFPEESQMSYYNFYYNSKGLSLAYDYGYDAWFDGDEEDDDISSQELEQRNWFQKQYTFLGETSLTISKTEAENYKVSNHFEAGEKEEILSAITRAIGKEYGKKKNKDMFVYVRDFLPGDSRLSGEVVDLDMTSENYMPLWWIQSGIHYEDEKREKFDDVYWDVHYSTGYSGASQPNYNPTVKQLKEWAKEEKEAVDVEKCILAYQIKDGELIDLKAEQNDKDIAGESVTQMK